MTVKELIWRLMDFNPDKEVYVRYIRGDRDGSATTTYYWLHSEDCITSDEDNNPVIDITDDM